MTCGWRALKQQNNRKWEININYIKHQNKIRSQQKPNWFQLKIYKLQISFFEHSSNSKSWIDLITPYFISNVASSTHQRNLQYLSFGFVEWTTIEFPIPSFRFWRCPNWCLELQRPTNNFGQFSLRIKRMKCKNPLFEDDEW